MAVNFSLKCYLLIHWSKTCHK